jgi:hypothetical protein
MSYEKRSYRLVGIAPLLMHNGQLADPLAYHSKELKKVSGKRLKTDADFERMAEIEFKGSLYLDDDGPVIPAEMIEAMIIESSKRMRKGQQIKAGVIVDGCFRLEYDGPRDPEALWADRNFRLTCGARVQRNRVMRTRPRFRDWSVEIEIEFIPSLVNPSELDEMVKLGGMQIGVGDWRPRFGRFMIG